MRFPSYAIAIAVLSFASVTNADIIIRSNEVTLTADMYLTNENIESTRSQSFTASNFLTLGKHIWDYECIGDDLDGLQGYAEFWLGGSEMHLEAESEVVGSWCVAPMSSESGSILTQGWFDMTFKVEDSEAASIWVGIEELDGLAYVKLIDLTTDTVLHQSQEWNWRDPGAHIQLQSDHTYRFRSYVQDFGGNDDESTVAYYLSGDYGPVSVPEPGAWLLFGFGLVGLLSAKRPETAVRSG
jgi:hypothetical protein